ncbi:MAG TPA: hypothetical protein VFU47_00285, partial [Armatimonadota bacterium]|nr:hypothetical protein [Armatimonadota bacterium]
RGLLVGAAIAGAAYWASRQPGGIKGTIDRLQQGFRDIQAGQDPVAVGKRFFRGGTEEPAGMYTNDPDVEAAPTGFQQPYRDYVSG